MGAGWTRVVSAGKLSLVSRDPQSSLRLPWAFSPGRGRVKLNGSSDLGSGVIHRPSAVSGLEQVSSQPFRKQGNGTPPFYGMNGKVTI